jgi:glycosyltransferase involved in cell wall biosynthesis
MNILNVNMSLDPVTGGGTVERTVQISRALVRAGHHCTILTIDIGSIKEQSGRLTGVDIISLPCINKRFYLPKFSFGRICRLVNNADIIHLMGHWTFINALVYFIARRQKRPYVVCPAGALPLYGRSRIIKILYNIIIGNRIVRNANGHIAITCDEIRQFIPYGIDTDNITVIANGINEDEFRNAQTEIFRSKYGLGQNPFILFVGRLNSIKGPDLLLQAFCALEQELQEYHLVFTGPDEGMLPELKNMTDYFNVSGRVHFLGYIGGEDKSQAYHGADLLVIPSRQEAMSIVALEAGAAGTPVLLTDQCGFNEVAEVNGGKVVPATVEGIRKGLQEMLSKLQQLSSLGHNLRQYVCEHHTWDAVISKYLSVYNHILAGNN